MIPLPLIPTIPVEVLLEAYHEGRFPMCHEDGNLYWHDPDPRAVFPLEHIVPNARMQRALRSSKYRFSFDTAFPKVIRACAAREETWIDQRLIASYEAMFRAGHAHSVEVWQEKELVGGIYGVAIGGAFFGESMFNNRPNAGKLAFYKLVQQLKEREFMLFDTQYVNDFTASLGAVEIAQSEFKQLLAQALRMRVRTQ